MPQDHRESGRRPFNLRRWANPDGISPELKLRRGRPGDHSEHHVERYYGAEPGQSHYKLRVVCPKCPPSSVQEKSGWGHNPTLVFLAAAGIQSPFPHPNTWDNAGVIHTGPAPLAERRGVLRIPTRSIEIKGSGFPLRRERRGWSPGCRRCKCDCPGRRTDPFDFQQ